MSLVKYVQTVAAFVLSLFLIMQPTLRRSKLFICCFMVEMFIKNPKDKVKESVLQLENLLGPCYDPATCLKS